MGRIATWHYIEQRGNSYRIIFRFRGQRITRSLFTTDEGAAVTSLHCLEDNLRRARLGTFVVPMDADPAAFLLSDGNTTAKPAPAIPPKPELTVEHLCDQFLNSMPESAIESTTHQTQFPEVIALIGSL